jgi:hypothetical protein
MIAASACSTELTSLGLDGRNDSILEVVMTLGRSGYPQPKMNKNRTQNEKM